MYDWLQMDFPGASFIVMADIWIFLATIIKNAVLIAALLVTVFKLMLKKIKIVGNERPLWGNSKLLEIIYKNMSLPHIANIYRLC